MAIPGILARGATPLGAITPPAPAAGTPDPVVIKAYRNYAQYQIMSMWCWNASGASIADYFGVSSWGTSSVYQCDNAIEYSRGASGCCELKIFGIEFSLRFVALMKKFDDPIHIDIGDVPCNQGGDPADVIEGTGELDADYDRYSGNGPDDAEYQRIVDNLDADYPVIQRIGWDSGGGHLMPIYGISYLFGLRVFLLADPWSGFKMQLAPPSNGTWTGTYFIERVT